MAERADVVIVGAGSAGCVLAARLSEDRDRTVVLLDAGPGGVPTPGQRSPSFLDAVGEQERIWPGLLVRRTRTQKPEPYMVGRGVGGGSAVNAMLALHGEPGDYDRWAGELGCEGWGWRDVERVFRSWSVPMAPVPEPLWGPVGAALVDACSASAATLNIDDSGVRAGAAEIHLIPALGRPNLSVRTDVTVEQVLLHGRSAVGVELSDGETIEAGEVVLSAGAFGSPRLLLASGVARSGIGGRLKDHPAVGFTLTLRPEARAGLHDLVITTLLRTSSSRGEMDLQLLPMNHLGPDPAAEGLAQLMVALMQVRSSGSLDATSACLDLLEHEDDAARMRDGVRLLLDVVEREPFARIATEVACDDVGTPAASLRELEDGALDEWLGEHLVSYFHAACSCSMGPADDAAAVVDTAGRVHGYEALRVCDTSIFPDLPRAGTNLPVMMVAERIAAAMTRV